MFTDDVLTYGREYYLDASCLYALQSLFQELSEGQPFYTRKGICQQVYDAFAAKRKLHVFGDGQDYNAVSAFIWKLSVDWAHYSGEPGFPVPHEKYGAKEAHKKVKFMWVGDYGRMHRDLADYLYRRVMKELVRRRLDGSSSLCHIVMVLLSACQGDAVRESVITAHLMKLNDYFNEKEKGRFLKLSDHRRAAQYALEIHNII